MISPVGNLIGSTTSEGMLALSLQWMRVSSRSNTRVFFPEKPRKKMRNCLKIFLFYEQDLVMSKSYHLCESA